MNRSVLAAALVGLACANAAQAQDAVVRIGIATPTTGPVAHLGKDMDQGARLAIDDLNLRGLVIGGRAVRFEAVTEDDRADPAAATAVAYKFADQKVQGVVGHLNSGPTLAAAKIYGDAGIPQVAPVATNPKYTQLGYPAAVRLMATDLQQAQVIAEFIAKSFAKAKVAIVDDRTAYGQGLADQVASDLGKASVAVIQREYTTDKAADFTAILTAIRASRADVIVYAGADAQAGPMNRQMKQLGIDAKFVAGDGSCTGAWTKLSSGANEGSYCTHAGTPPSRMPGIAKFKRQFHDRYGSDFLIFAPFGYDAVMVLAEAMKMAGSTDPRAYAAFLRKVDVAGVTGRIRFDSQGDNPNAMVTAYQVRGGKLEELAP